MWFLSNRFISEAKDMLEEVNLQLEQGLGIICADRMKQIIGFCEKKSTIKDSQLLWVYGMACCFYEESFFRFGGKSDGKYLIKAEQIGKDNNFWDINFWVSKCKLESLVFSGRSRKINEAKEEVFSCIDRLEKREFYQLNILPILVWSALNQGDFNLAKELNDKFLDLAVKFNSINGQVNAKRFFGKIAFENDKLDEALGYFQEALDLGKDRKIEQIVPAFYNMGEFYLFKNDLEKAKQYLSLARDALDKELKLFNGLYHIHIDRLEGVLSKLKKSFSESEDYLKRSITLAQDNDNLIEEGISYLELGKLYLDMGDYSKATLALEEAGAKFIIIDNSFWLSKVKITQKDIGERRRAMITDVKENSPVISFHNKVLDEFIRLVLSSLNLDDVLNNIIEYTMNITKADRGFLILHDEKGQLYSQVVRIKGKSEEKDKVILENFSRSIVRKALENKSSILLTDAQSDSRFSASVSIAALDIRSVICVPLKTDKSEIIGLIYIDKKNIAEAFNSQDLALVELLGSYASIALVNARLHAGVRRRLETAEAQLIQSEKMATLGVLAGGVAHEINNPLGAILLNAEMLLKDIDKGPYREMLEIIGEGARRCKNIVELLLQYARKTSGRFEKIDLNQIVDKVCAFLEYQLLQDKIEITKHKEDNFIYIDGNFNEIMQVFTNIIVNAKEAIKALKESGNINLRTKKDNDLAVIEISDDGIGIPPENIPKIFDPFFTTKEVGRGTGLGLSIVYRIIENHRGSIEVFSKVKEGTTFVIRLPLSKN
ncbi:MAG: ATP-binding protein [Candidatus Omnitrophica bacterium]|nr:ATP-binding protein [Candidatus Omnitrophota bacterium]